MRTPDGRRWMISNIAACVLHAAVFLGGTLMTSPAEYGVEAGAGGLEIHLVAAPAGPSGQPLDAATPEAVDAPAETAAEVPSRTEPDAKTGDGSSPVPGTDATTLHAPGGARARPGPAHVRNPAPAYPQRAREQGQEGLVLVRAEVLPTGRCGQLQIAQSSGYVLLDQAAADAIRRWRFQPAHRAGHPVGSWVEIPVRFQLVDEGGLP